MSASNRSLLFFLGLAIGLLGGAGFFIFKMDELIKNGNIFNSKRDTLIIQQQSPIDNPAEKNQKKEFKENKNTVKKVKNDTVLSDKSSAELFAQKYPKEIPIKTILAESDSLLADTMQRVSAIEEDKIVVRKDELLSSKKIQVKNLEEATTPTEIDTLLEKISGIHNKNADSFAVEFWESPINYRGYKMTKNKIILFGINQNEEIKLFQLDGKIIMSQNKNYYSLHFTDNFKQFEKITSPSVLSKIK